MDNSSNPLSAQLGGSFSPSKDVIQHKGGGSYPDIVTTYTAPDNRSTQKIQIRVSNEQEIGVTQHFTINVTDDLDTEHTVDTNPVIESFSAERLSNNELKFVGEIYFDKFNLNSKIIDFGSENDDFPRGGKWCGRL